MPLAVRARDLAALRAAGAALLDVDAPAPALAARLVAHLGPAFGIESAWGVEVPLGGADADPGAPVPFADPSSADLAGAVARLAELRPAAVTLRERAAGEAALRLLAGAAHVTWHHEEFPRRLGANYAAFTRTAVYHALFAPGRGATATGFVSSVPGSPASLILSRRAPDRPARRARVRPLLALLAPAVHGRHALRARLGRVGVAGTAAAGARADALSTPALLLAPDGTEAHRNAALTALLARPAVDAAGVLHAMHAAGAAGLALARVGARGGRGSAAELRLADAPLAGVGAALQVGAVPWGGDWGVLVTLGEVPRGGPSDGGGAPLAGDGEAPPGGTPVWAAAHDLTARERQVAALLAARRTNAEVAAALGVSVHTVRRHVERVLRKLGARSRLEVRARLGAGD